MASEAVLKLKLEEPWDWIVDNLRSILKGTLCKISGVGTVAASEATDTAPAWGGVARREKIASDGRTRLAMFRRGVFDMVAAAGTTIPEGSWVTISGVNTIRIATAAEVAAGKGIGTAREEITSGSTGEIIGGGA